jgi:tetratricopeptide (TPR) repeat protein
MSAFSDELAQLMAASGIGVRELARQSTFSAGYVSRLRSGVQAPGSETAARFDELLGGKGSLVAAAQQGRHQAHPVLETAWQPRPATGRGRGSGFAAGRSPVEHLHRMRGVLIEQDNLLGPGHVAPVLLDQITLIERLRQDSDGTDARELLLLQAMYSEFAAWCAQDIADFAAARYWLDRALELAHMTLDPVWPAYILARKAQLAADMRDPLAAIGLARAAAAADPGRSRLSAVAGVYRAQGHAMAGEEAEAMSVLETAREQATADDESPDVPWAPWLGPLYVAVHEARCASALGRHERAAEIYAQAISGIPDRMCRDRGVYIARMALALARAGQHDAAASAGLEAVAVAATTRSGRIVTELRQLDAAVARHRTQATAELRQALSATLRQSRH